MRRALPSLVCFFASALLLHGADAPAYRTDADGPSNKKVLRPDGKPLEWFQLVDGEFPPEGSAHAISGELIFVEHPKRTFRIRVDRDDSQDRGKWDLPLEADMLPYGSIHYHGSLAALPDIPLGTHLRGLFYWRSARRQDAAARGPVSPRRHARCGFPPLLPPRGRLLLSRAAEAALEDRVGERRGEKTHRAPASGRQADRRAEDLRDSPTPRACSRAAALPNSTRSSPARTCSSTSPGPRSTAPAASPISGSMPKPANSPPRSSASRIASTSATAACPRGSPPSMTSRRSSPSRFSATWTPRFSPT